MNGKSTNPCIFFTGKKINPIKFESIHGFTATKSILSNKSGI